MSRLAAFLVDMTAISLSYTATVALISYMVGLFTGHTVDPSKGSVLALGGYLLFAFCYFWIGLAVTGRSIGKGLIGLRVVAVGGDPISPGRADAMRTKRPAASGQAERPWSDAGIRGQVDGTPPTAG